MALQIQLHVHVIVMTKRAFYKFWAVYYCTGVNADHGCSSVSNLKGMTVCQSVSAIVIRAHQCAYPPPPRSSERCAREQGLLVVVGNALATSSPIARAASPLLDDFFLENFLKLGLVSSQGTAQPMPKLQHYISKPDVK